jgi:hypothetical protein
MLMHALVAMVAMTAVAGAELTPAKDFAACPVLRADPEQPCTPDGPACDDGDPCTVGDHCEPCTTIFCPASHTCSFDDYSYRYQKQQLQPYHECRWSQAAAFLAQIEAGAVDVGTTRPKLLRRLARRVEALQKVAATTTPDDPSRKRRFRLGSKRMLAAWYRVRDAPTTVPGLAMCLYRMLPFFEAPCHSPSPGGSCNG